MKLLNLFALALVLLMPSLAQQRSLEAVPAEFAAAFEARSLERYLALFHPDAVFTDLGSRFAGTAEIRRIGQMIIDARGTYTTRSVSVDGNKITWRFDFRQPSGYFLRGEGIFVMREGRIVTLDIGRQP